MDYLLYRCSGSSFCHYTRRLQRGCLRMLAYYDLFSDSLPPVLTGVQRPPVAQLRVPCFLPRRRSLCADAKLTPAFSLSPLLPGLVSEELERVPGRMREALKTEDSAELNELLGGNFASSGKLLRPMTVLLMAAATGDGISEAQKRLAAITELIHAASLVHDDVIDESPTRRNLPTLHALSGNKKAILVGDYILAKATQLLCSIGKADVISLLAQVIEDLVRGELMQLGAMASPESRFVHYMEKSFRKTASLFARSCEAAALLAPRTSVDLQRVAHEYGRNLGLAFQLMDDVLDFVSLSTTLGKPVLADLRLGLATAPVLFAARQHKELDAMILRRFSGKGDVEKAWELVAKSGGVLETKKLARSHSLEAVRQVRKLPATQFSEALEQLAVLQLERQR